jgi:hypothetical protein
VLKGPMAVPGKAGVKLQVIFSKGKKGSQLN